MALKSKILQLYHKSLKLSLILTIWGGYSVAIAPSNPAAANTTFTESRKAENRQIYPAINRGEINRQTPILQAQNFPQQPVLLPPLPPPTISYPSSELPPPPPIIYGEELERSGENSRNSTGFANLRYAVYVNGNSPWLLKIIREIESKAVLRKYQNRRVIQVGSFSDRFFAEDLANFFQFQGIKAQIVKLNSGEKFGDAVATENTDLFPPVVQPIDYGLGETDAYYVLIPEESRNLPSLQEEVVLLGVPRESVLVTEVPPNLAVGPFNSEVTAQLWQGYLQDVGFSDAELYFGR